MAQIEPIKKYQDSFFSHSKKAAAYEAPDEHGYASVYWSANHHALARDKDGDYWRLVTSHELNETIQQINNGFAKVNVDSIKEVAASVVKVELEQMMEAKFAQMKESIIADLKLEESLTKHSTAHDAKLKQLRSELDTQIADMQVDSKLADHQAMLGAKFAEVKQVVDELQLDQQLADLKLEQEARLQQLKSELDSKTTHEQVDTKLADHQANTGVQFAEMKESTAGLDAKLADLKAEHEAKLQQHKSESDTKIADMQLDTKLADHHATVGAKMTEVKENTIAELKLDEKLANLSILQEERLQELKSEFERKLANIHEENILAEREAILSAEKLDFDATDAELELAEQKRKLQQVVSKMIQDEFNHRDNQSIFCFGKSTYE